MRRTHLNWIVGLVLALPALCAAASAATLAVGTASAGPGQAVSIPVTLTAGVDCTSALLRVEYDPAVLESPSAAPGPLVSQSHALDSFCPAAGRLNVCVYSFSGAPAFAAQTGVLCYLTFTVKAGAPAGPSNITITTQGAPALPASGLVDTTGAAVAHTATPGSVEIKGTTGANFWRLY